MKKIFPKLIAGFISIVIISLLIFLGPAQAFILKVSVSDNFNVIGEPITFTLSTEIQESEILNIEFINLTLQGATPVSCSFLANGTKISPCPNVISIDKLSAPNTTFGYGYGYTFNQGILKYLVVLNSSNFLPGEYNVYYTIITASSSLESPAEKIFIGNNFTLTESCSVRADSGSISFLNNTFDEKNKLNFNLPLKEAKKGEGSLTAQDKRSRISYTFIMEKAVKLSKDKIVFKTSGLLRDDLKNPIPVKAILTMDKKINKIDISGDIEAESMYVTFTKGC